MKSTHIDNGEVMICSNCGKEIKEEWNVCTYCGWNLKQKNVTSGDNVEKTASNNNEILEPLVQTEVTYSTSSYQINESDQMIDRFKKMQMLLCDLNKYISLAEQERTALEPLYKQYNEMRKPFYYLSKEVYLGIKFGAALIGGVFGFCRNGSMFSSIVWAIIFLVIGGVVADIINHKQQSKTEVKKKVDEEAFIKAKTFYEESITPRENKLNEYRKVLLAIDDCHTSEVIKNEIPLDYQNEEALSFFVHALNNRRAENEKELFNLYEEEVHRQRMLKYAKEGVEIQKQTLQSQREQISRMDEQLRTLQSMREKQDKISKQVKYGNVVSTLDAVHHWDDNKKK